jgi:hypothetical protein
VLVPAIRYLLPGYGERDSKTPSSCGWQEEKPQHLVVEKISA